MVQTERFVLLGFSSFVSPEFSTTLNGQMALVLYKEQSITNASVIADNIKYSKKHEMFLSVGSDRNE